MYYSVFTQEESHEDREKRLQRGCGVWVVSLIGGHLSMVRKGRTLREEGKCEPRPETTHSCEMWTCHPLGESVFRQTLLCAFYVPKLGGGDANRNQKWSYMDALTVKSIQLSKGGSRLDSGWRAGCRKDYTPALGKNISQRRKLKHLRQWIEELEEEKGKVTFRDNCQVSKVQLCWPFLIPFIRFS